MSDLFLMVFTAIIAIQCCYYFLFSASQFLKNKKNENSNGAPISVLVCAKNEAENLQQLVPKLLKQQYKGDFELVCINDRSSDNTLEVLREFANKHSNITIVNVNENEHFWGSKKYALSLGIKASKHDLLLFTDADCVPNTVHWMQTMANEFNNEKAIVLGYGSYKKIPHSWLNKIIRFETLLTAVQYFSYALLGNPYMGVGRNLAYKKELFFKNKGFHKHIKLNSGDDDLFVNEIATKKNIAVNLESFTTSEVHTKFSHWIHQKRRHISTAKYYKKTHQLLLGLFFISQFIFFVSLGMVIATNSFENTVVILVFLRYLGVYTALGVYAKKLKEMDVLIWVPFLEIQLVFVQIYIYLKNKIELPTTWSK